MEDDVLYNDSFETTQPAMEENPADAAPLPDFKNMWGALEAADLVLEAERLRLLDEDPALAQALRDASSVFLDFVMAD
jgi:hypothetical protein